MAYENILVETHDNVGLIRLNRPQALNALTAALVADLNHALKAFADDDAIGAIVLTGSDKAFAAGADIKEIQTTHLRRRLSSAISSRTWEYISTVRKPVIAAVAGFALGGGCEFAMMCDFIVAADNAKFGQPEIKLGVIPGAGGTQRLSRFVGKSKAMDMVLTGRMMDAAEAERCGLVSRVFPLADLVPEAIKIAKGVASLGARRRLRRKGERQHRLRDHARRGRPFRTPSVLRPVRDRGPEGRHEGLCREAAGGVQEQVGRVCSRARRARALGIFPFSPCGRRSPKGG